MTAELLMLLIGWQDVVLGVLPPSWLMFAIIIIIILEFTNVRTVQTSDWRVKQSTCEYLSCSMSKVGLLSHALSLSLFPIDLTMLSLFHPLDAMTCAPMEAWMEGWKGCQIRRKPFAIRTNSRRPGYRNHKCVDYIKSGFHGCRSGASKGNEWRVHWKNGSNELMITCCKKVRKISPDLLMFYTRVRWRVKTGHSTIQ